MIIPSITCSLKQVPTHLDPSFYQTSSQCIIPSSRLQPIPRSSTPTDPLPPNRSTPNLQQRKERTTPRPIRASSPPSLHSHNHTLRRTRSRRLNYLTLTNRGRASATCGSLHYSPGLPNEPHLTLTQPTSVPATHE